MCTCAAVAPRPGKALQGMPTCTKPRHACASEARHAAALAQRMQGTGATVPCCSWPPVQPPPHTSSPHHQCTAASTLGMPAANIRIQHSAPQYSSGAHPHRPGACSCRASGQRSADEVGSGTATWVSGGSRHTARGARGPRAIAQGEGVMQCCLPVEPPPAAMTTAHGAHQSRPNPPPG